MNEATDPNMLNVGRELDALVADRVMGLTFEKRWIRSGYYELEPELSDETSDTPPDDPPFQYEQDLVVITGESFGSPLWHVVPYYSTDIAAAWQVMEYMRANGFIDIVITTGTDDALWTVGIHRRDVEWHLAWGDTSGDGRSKAPVAHDESLPLAICRAALAATADVPDHERDQ